MVPAMCWMSVQWSRANGRSLVLEQHVYLSSRDATKSYVNAGAVEERMLLSGCPNKFRCEGASVALARMTLRSILNTGPGLVYALKRRGWVFEARSRL